MRKDFRYILFGCMAGMMVFANSFICFGEDDGVTSVVSPAKPKPVRAAKGQRLEVGQPNQGLVDFVLASGMDPDAEAMLLHLIKPGFCAYEKISNRTSLAGAGLAGGLVHSISSELDRDKRRDASRVLQQDEFDERIMRCPGDYSPPSWGDKGVVLGVGEDPFFRCPGDYSPPAWTPPASNVEHVHMEDCLTEKSGRPGSCGVDCPVEDETEMTVEAVGCGSSQQEPDSPESYLVVPCKKKMIEDAHELERYNKRLWAALKTFRSGCCGGKELDSRDTETVLFTEQNYCPFSAGCSG